MRWLVFAAAAAIVGCAGEAPAQTFTTTNCMMTCNSQAATCQAACFVPGTPPVGSTTPALLAAQAPGPNTTASTTCVMNCTTTQLTCQTTCAKVAPSQ
jgi:hypothetical protein